MSAINDVSQCHGATVHTLCDALTLSRATYYRYHEAQGKVAPDTPKRTPENALSCEERHVVLEMLHSERFIDKSPYDIYYALLRHIGMIFSGQVSAKAGLAALEIELNTMMLDPEAPLKADGIFE